MSFIVKCPACSTQNRVKDETNQNPLCGKCKTPLLIQNVAPILLTDITFDNYIRKSHRPVLVDFWAGWCAPCRLLAPILDAFIMSQHSIIVAKVDTERNPLITSKFKVFSIPTLILFDKGEEVKRITGALPLQALEDQLKNWISVN
jgi:thioredoxin 2